MIMRYIESQKIYEWIRDTIVQAATHLPEDVLEALNRGLDCEEQESAREILRQLLDNAEMARESGLPLCQDTGLAIFFVEKGEDCHIDGGKIQDILNKAMIEAYKQGYLRKSVCHPLSRQNSGDNSPAVIHMDEVVGDGLRIKFMAKGGGSENMSRCTMLTPAQGWPGIKDFVLKRVAESGPNPCPPTVIGLGIGGSFDLAPILAKKALFRSLNEPHPDKDLANLEDELLEEINALGVGPMGIGGRTTSLGVRINIAPCHIASLPLAVNIQCHSVRHREVVFA